MGEMVERSMIILFVTIVVIKTNVYIVNTVSRSFSDSTVSWLLTDCCYLAIIKSHRWRSKVLLSTSLLLFKTLKKLTACSECEEQNAIGRTNYRCMKKTHLVSSPMFGTSR